MNKEQRKFYERKLEVLEKDYNRVRATTNALRCDISDLSFEERVQDPQERYLMVEKLKTLEGVQTNMLNLIRFYCHKVNANKPEPWEGNEAVRTVDTPCGPVNLVNQDKVSKEQVENITHHCGQDAENIKDWLDFKPTDRYRISVDIAADGDKAASCSVEEQPVVTYKDLLGMEVVGYGGSKTRCVGCPQESGTCVKVELVGGDCLCLAKRPVVTGLDDSQKSWEDVYRENMELLRRYTIEQSEANQRLIKAMKKAYEKESKPVISFDDEPNVEKSHSDIMKRIKEKADAFMDYLDSVIDPARQ